MKKAFFLSILFLFAFSQAFAVNFSPTVLTISAPAYVQYNFDGSTVSIPVKITGQPANSLFLVFTKDQGSAVSQVQNGYLGWHYVNKIDTCLYVSNNMQFGLGNNNIAWNGKNADGKAVPKGEYTYYIWGYDNINFKIPVTKQINPNPWSRITLETMDKDGKALAKPVMWFGSTDRGGGGAANTVDRNHQNKKWTVGSDPADSSMMEFCWSRGVCDPGGLAWNPTNHDLFFKSGLNNNGFKIFYAWKWIPNGSAELQTDWGEDGMTRFTVGYPPSWEYGPGCVSDGGDLLMTTNGDLSGATTEAEIVYVDINDGTEIQRLDVSDWYVDISDGENGGQSSSGPSEFSMWGTYAVTGAHSTCMNLLFDVHYTDEDEAVLWANSNGDYTGDHNFEADSAKPWVCNDYNVGPYKYDISIEANGFSFFPSFDMGAVSFGLYAPDGTGLSYQALAGETAMQKYDTSCISYNSSYDGLLVSNQSIVPKTDATDEQKAAAIGWFWVGMDTFKGIITNQVDVAEAPSAFAVAQNSPNPFNPTTTISFAIPEAGNVSVDVFNVAGQKVETVASEFMSAGSHSVTWDASGLSAGVYFYTVKTGSFSKTMKMTLLK